MRTIYIDPSGEKHYAKPNHYQDKKGRNWYGSPTDEQLISAGWTIEEVIDPIPEPYVPTVEELVQDALRNGADGGSPTYSIPQEFEVQRKRDEDPDAFATYNARVEACIAWANAQPHRDAEEGV